MAVVAVLGPSQALADPPQPLPAGIYFRHHAYASCTDCQTPGWALVYRVTADSAEVYRALGALEAVALPLGYPLLAHTDELGLAAETSPGIAVVLGLFPDDVSAALWQASLGEWAAGARVMPLLSADDAFARLLSAATSDDHRPRRVVRISAGAPVPAYDAQAVERAIAALDRGRDAGAAEIVAGLPVLCLIPGGSFFVAPTHPPGGHVYLFAPVDCDGAPAVALWEHTLLDGAIVSSDDGHELHQIVGAECDSPARACWRYSANGRGELLSDERGAGGCF